MTFNPNPKAKHWAGCTLNNYTEDDLHRFGLNIAPLADYYVFGKEIAPSGTPHLQFMICFKSQKSLIALKKLLPGAHLEVKSRNSTMLEASNYCKKVFHTLFFIITLVFSFHFNLYGRIMTSSNMVLYH